MSKSNKGSNVKKGGKKSQTPSATAPNETTPLSPTNNPPPPPITEENPKKKFKDENPETSDKKPEASPPPKGGENQGDQSRHETGDEGDIVEGIRGKKVMSGVIHYLIKWKGSEKKQWRRFDELEPIQAMVDEYEKNRKSQALSDQERQRSGERRRKGSFSDDDDYRVRDDVSYSDTDEENRGRRGKAIIMRKVGKPSVLKGTPDRGGADFFNTIHGHFIYGDIPTTGTFSRIERRQSGQMVYIFVVKWKKRPDGYRPMETEFTSQELLKWNPELLVTYYESKLRLKIEDADDFEDIKAELRSTLKDTTVVGGSKL